MSDREEDNVLVTIDEIDKQRSFTATITRIEEAGPGLYLFEAGLDQQIWNMKLLENGELQYIETEKSIPMTCTYTKNR